MPYALHLARDLGALRAVLRQNAGQGLIFDLRAPQFGLSFASGATITALLGRSVIVLRSWEQALAIVHPLTAALVLGAVAGCLWAVARRRPGCERQALLLIWLLAPILPLVFLRPALDMHYVQLLVPVLFVLAGMGWACLLAVPQRPLAWAAGVTLAAIVASILGVPVYLAMLIGALLVILAGVISMEEAARAVEWKAIFLIAGMYAVSLAMVQTGLADASGKLMVHLASPFGALGLAAGAYLLSALLTQVMGGQVTALVSGPVVISAAIRLGVSPQAVAVAAAIACSASFLTPLAHPVNILMIGPANYRFSDFFKVGWPLTLISFIMLLAGMKLFWGL
uniref:Citrate transporter-like domain-containing protein n=1 Tax=Anaerolinea thermolimosa TaxID=229919 RepID=A0A7C4KH19_9CHLR